MTPITIPVAEPKFGGREQEYVTDCILSSWVSSKGKYVTQFESMFAAYCGVPYGVATFNGTIALHLVLAALNIGPGDEVIVPSLTFVATANAVAYTGATPVFVDSEPETWNLDPAAVEAAITPRTRAIIPVHLYGHPADMDAIRNIARAHSLTVIEDAAEAHGATYRGQKVGSLGHAAAFSFYANKNITTGEGGMITTDNRQLADLCRNLRDHAFSPERHFWHKYLGFNYRMTNLQAAVGLAQVERMDELVAARRRNAARYTERLASIPGITPPPEAPDCTNVYWMYAVLVEDEFGLTRDELRRFLAGEGIETRTFFIPLHFQPIYYQAFKGQRFPVAENLCKRGFYYPSASSLTRREIDYIVDATRRAHEQRGSR